MVSVGGLDGMVVLYSHRTYLEMEEEDPYF